jgi:hypothetical protein
MAAKVLSFFGSGVWKVVYPIRRLVIRNKSLFGTIAVAGGITIAAKALAIANHGFLNMLDYARVQLAYITLASGVVLAMVINKGRHRLSMRAVHKKAFGLIGGNELATQRLCPNAPILLMNEKRIEVRTGGYYRIVYPSQVKEPKPSAGWVVQLLHAYRIPYVTFKPQRAHMVFPITGEYQRKAMVSVECVKRTSLWAPGGSENKMHTFKIGKYHIGEVNFAGMDRGCYSGGQRGGGGCPALWGSRYHRIPACFPLNMHAI